MKGVCKLVPVIKVGNEERDSLLFQDLRKMFSYTETKTIWAYTKLPQFKKALAASKIEVKLDENGEYTMDTVNSVLPLTSLSKGIETEKGANYIAGATTREGKTIFYDTVDEATGKVLKFNRENEKWVAYVDTEPDGTFRIEVRPRTDQNKHDVQKIVFNSSLNQKLRSIMQSLGFDVQVVKNPHFAGMFNPLNAMESAGNIKTVIQIAEGAIGEEAFPEEFAHFAIAGLRNTDTVRRVIKSIDSLEVIKTILGDKFERYNKIYRENFEKLQLEAAGHLLVKFIKGENDSFTQRHVSIIGRVIDSILGFFNIETSMAVDRAIQEANNELYAIYKSLEGEGLEDLIEKFDPSSVLSSSTLYALDEASKENDKLIELNEKILLTLARGVREVQLEHNASSVLFGTAKNRESELNKINTNLTINKEYLLGYQQFIQEATKDINRLKEYKNKVSLDVSVDSTLDELRNVAKWYKRAQNLTEVYGDIVSMMQYTRKLTYDGVLDFKENELTSLINNARSVETALKEVTDGMNRSKKAFVLTYIQKIMGKNKMMKVGNEKFTTETLELLIKRLDNDISIVDRLLSSMSEASDPILSLLDLGVKQSFHARDLQIKEYIRRIDALTKEFGEDTSFMYERDANGIPTGNFRNWYDYDAYNKAYKEYKEKLIEDYKAEKIKDIDIIEAISKFKRDNLKKRVVHTTKDGTSIIAIVPEKFVKYKNEEEFKATFTEKQWKYFNEMIAIKWEMDALIPRKAAVAFRAPQVRNDVTESLMHQGRGIWESTKIALSRLGDSFIIRDDDDSFGQRNNMVDQNEEIDPDNNNPISDTEFISRVDTDITGKALKKVPITFTKRLKNMKDLSTDASASMRAYCAMALNYAELSRIADTLEVTNSVLHEREVVSRQGNRPIYEIFSMIGRKFKTLHTDNGGMAADKFQDYINRNIFGEQKRPGDIKDILTFRGKTISINTAKLLDAFKSYSGIVSLGLNFMSALSNVTVGRLQQLIDANAATLAKMFDKEGEYPIGYFDMKDLTKSTFDYFTNIFGAVGECESRIKTNKLALLMEMFDAEEEFYENVRNTKDYGNTISRLIGNNSIYILNNLGEHYLHGGIMLAMLNRTKVKVNGSEMSLYDALTVVDKETRDVVTYQEGATRPTYKELVLPKGCTDMKGNLLSTEGLEVESAEYKTAKQNFEDFIGEHKRHIGRVNQSLNGAFNAADKGEIHQFALGRLVMQFRQWMPAHYSRRFAGFFKSKELSKYYDASLDEFREGYYTTLRIFTFQVIKDAIKFKFSLPAVWRTLDQGQKTNLIRALTEILLYNVLGSLVRLLGPAKDKEGYWMDRMLIYQLMRMRMETGASMPGLSFIDNIYTLLQSPMAAVTRLNDLTNLLTFSDMQREVESGKYEGWSQYKRNALNTLPIFKHFDNTWNIDTENNMFMIFNKTSESDLDEE